MSELFDIVARYADLGDHRTGTEVDARTVDWLADVLSGQGAEVSRQAFTFPKFTGHAVGTGSAEGVPLEPLYYSATGDHQESEAFVTSISFNDHHGDAAIERQVREIARQAQASNAAIAIAATLCASGGLCAINRAPVAPGKVPICLAPGRALEALGAGAAGVRFTAEISTSRAENLIALFADASSEVPPLVVTTPVSGWFACAGERGTGIALALALAQELARQVPVLLVMTSGHELGYFGAARFVESFDRPVKGVLHLGSCLADKTALSEDGGMWAVSNLSGAGFERIASALAALNVVPRRPDEPTSPSEWMGESELWAPRGAPMLSIAGTSRSFHTAEDVAERVTSPELLEQVRSCVLAGAQALIA